MPSILSIFIILIITNITLIIKHFYLLNYKLKVKEFTFLLIK